MAESLVGYDSGCALCRCEISMMRHLDRACAISFAGVDQMDGDCPIDRKALLARFHAQENGEIVSGAAASAAMWQAIPMLRPLGLLARNKLVLASLDRLYLVVLRVRTVLQFGLRWAGQGGART